MSIRGRFGHRRQRYRLVFGRDVDGWTEARARQEMENIRVLLRTRMPVADVLARYTPDTARKSTGDVSFHAYASEWLARRGSGELGHRLPSQSTRMHYRWALSHILPSFAGMQIATITKRDCERFRGKLFADSETLRAMIAAGAKPTQHNGQLRRPLSPSSIRSVMLLLAQILEDAVEDELRPDNPARAKRLHIRLPRPKRTFLEIDQLVALLDAARELEQTPATNKRAKLTHAQAEEIRARLAHGETQRSLCAEYGVSSPSMSVLARGRTYRNENTRVGWRALCSVLGYAGLRISEVLNLRERDVRLHDPHGSRLWIPDSKTPTGVRHVAITPTLRHELLHYQDEKLALGYPRKPETPFFCTPKGTRWDANNVRQKIFASVTQLASLKLTERGLPPLPHITPHSLRRTYVSIMLLATNFDIPFVQHQIGHTQAHVTLDVYNQLLDRGKREHTAAFDTLLTSARNTLYSPDHPRIPISTSPQ